MKVAVTGGGGFIGTAIVRRLIERGDDVRVLGRRTYPHIEKLGGECREADVRDLAAITEATRGVDLVVHTAGLAGIWGRRETFLSINAEGTRNVIAACRENGISRLVYTSSPSVVFGLKAHAGVNESAPYPPAHLAPYPESKAIAEQAVLAANDDKLATVAIRPHMIWGPGDPHLLPRVVRKAQAGKLPRVGDGKNLTDICFVDNAAHAHILAIDRLDIGSACSGRPYFVAQERPVELWTWINELLERVGVEPIRRSVSYGLARNLGGLFERMYGLLRIRAEPPMTRFVAAQLAESHYFDQSAAGRDLGYEPVVSLEQGMDRTVPWLRENVVA